MTKNNLFRLALVCVALYPQFSQAQVMISRDVEYYISGSVEDENVPRWMVDEFETAVSFISNNNASCSATLVARRWLLTAGHCNIYTNNPGNIPDSGPAIGVGTTAVFDYQCHNPDDPLDTCSLAEEDSNDAPAAKYPTVVNEVFLQTDPENDLELDYLLARLSSSGANGLTRNQGIRPLAAIELASGERVTAVTHPHGLPKKVESGVHTGRAFDQGISYFYTDRLHLVGGSSGGGIFDDSGFLVSTHVFSEPNLEDPDHSNSFSVPVVDMWRDRQEMRDIAAVWRIGPRMKDIAVNAHGDLYGIRLGGLNYIAKYNPNSNTWQDISSHEAERIHAGGHRLYSVDRNEQLRVYDNQQWKSLGPVEGELAVANDGRLFMIYNDHQAIKAWDGQWYSVVGGNGFWADKLYPGTDNFYYRNGFAGTVSRWNKSVNNFTVISSGSDNHVDFAVSKLGDVYRMTSEGEVQQHLSDTAGWRKVGENAEQLYAGQGDIYYRSKHSGEIYTEVESGLWDRFTRPVDKLVAAHTMIAVIDKKTGDIHRYRERGMPEFPVIQANLVERVPYNGRSYPQDQQHYVLHVPEGTDELRVILNIANSNTDLDIYAKRLARPTRENYAWEAIGSGGENRTVRPIAAGQWHIMVDHFSGPSSDFELEFELKNDLPTTPKGCNSCTHYEGEMQYSWDEGYLPQINGNTYYWAYSGWHEAWLEGPSGTDFDMELQKWTGSYWATLVGSYDSSSSEYASYYGSSGYYRWHVYSYSGSGAYNFWLQRP